MIASPAKLLQVYLINVGVGSAPPSSDPAQPVLPWPIYVSQRPDGQGIPDNLIAIYDPMGWKQGRLMATGQTIITPGVQFIVRGDSYPTAYSKAQELFDALDRLRREGVTAYSQNYELWTVKHGPIISMGQDVNGNRQRMLLSQNGTLSYTSA